MVAGFLFSKMLLQDSESSQTSPCLFVATATNLPNYPYQPQKDVLSGRGECFKRNNLFYRKLVAKFFPDYEACSNNRQKRATAFEVVRLVQKGGGRFLDKEGKELPDRLALHKTMKALKDRRSALKPRSPSPALSFVQGKEQDSNGPAQQPLSFLRLNSAQANNFMSAQQNVERSYFTPLTRIDCHDTRKILHANHDQRTDEVESESSAEVSLESGDELSCGCDNAMDETSEAVLAEMMADDEFWQKNKTQLMSAPSVDIRDVFNFATIP